MTNIKQLTKEQLFDITEIATGGYFNSQWASNQREVECGGYGLRRRIEWTQNTDGYDDYHYFEISAEAKDLGWKWHSKCTQDLWYDDPNWEKSSMVICLNPSAIVDYCDKNNIDIRNKQLV